MVQQFLQLREQLNTKPALRVGPNQAAYAAGVGAAPVGPIGPPRRGVAGLLEEAAKKAGFSGEALRMAVAIGLAEGGGAGTRHTNSDKRRTVDRGYWQWNNYWHPEVTDAMADDPYASAQQLYRVSGGGRNWSPWSTYKNGAYRQYL